MKRRVSALKLAMIFALVLPLVACGQNSTGTALSSEPTTAESNSEAVTTTSTTATKEIAAKELMKSVNARKAIAHAFDKSYITEMILGDGSVPADFFVPANIAVLADGTDFRDKYPDGWNHFDKAKALEYWEAAKAELDFSGVNIEFLTYDSEGSKKISEFIQGQLQDTLPGLTVVLNQQPFKNKLELANNGEFELEFAGWGPDYPDSLTYLDMWLSGGGHNTAGYSNPTYDDNITRAKTGDLTADLIQRNDVLQETEKILLEDDCVLIPLYQRGDSFLENPEVTGIVHHYFGSAYTYMDATTTVETDGKHIIRLTDTADIPTMDTNKATSSLSFNLMGNVLEGLVGLGEGDVVQPAGALSWETSDDRTEYVFHLNPDAKWSNGDSVTAHDYVYSWRRLADPETGSQYQFMIETAQLKNYQKVMAGEMPTTDLGVEAVDDYTLKVTLDIEVPYFEKLMFFPNFYPVNQKFVESVGDSFGTSVETTLYNGPYVLDTWDIGYGYSIAKNPTYYNTASVKNDGVTWRIVKDAATGVNLYETKEVDKCRLSAEFVEQYIDHPHFGTWKGAGIYYLIFNIDNQGAGQH